MKMDILGNKYLKNPNVVTRMIANEVILVPIHKSVGNLEKIFVLNDVAAYIWDNIDSNITVIELVDLIMSEFDVNYQVAEEDTCELIQLFEDKNFIIRNNIA